TLKHCHELANEETRQDGDGGDAGPEGRELYRGEDHQSRLEFTLDTLTSLTPSHPVPQLLLQNQTRWWGSGAARFKDWGGQGQCTAHKEMMASPPSFPCLRSGPPALDLEGTWAELSTSIDHIMKRPEEGLSGVRSMELFEVCGARPFVRPEHAKAGKTLMRGQTSQGVDCYCLSGSGEANSDNGNNDEPQSLTIISLENVAPSILDNFSPSQLWTSTES
ncbi:hypothetical protein BDK51DRAFT_33736, partial [Blyttiomyces helicus]